MKMSCRTKKERGLTLVEVLMVVAALTILAALLLPVLYHEPKPALRIQCVNNLKQDGLAFRIWEGDHNDKFPPRVAETNGGSMEFVTGPNAFRHFQVMSNELSTPKVLICPKETDKARFIATNFVFMSNSNLSFFVGVDATDSNPQMILSGDHNITNGTALKNGLLELTTNSSAGWTAEMHNGVGNVLLADGSVQQVANSNLQIMIAYAGLQQPGEVNPEFVTNRLQMPILGP
jgi:prepilin-type N-terminal cleavage/methylation domain-containing protein/prepilin-type processing-associated H-X9-DG protein